MLTPSLPKLNFPHYDFRIQEEEDHKYRIFDLIRRRWIILTPEEWVRQNMVRFMVDYLHIPQGRLANEVSLSVGGRRLRCDSLVYSAKKHPLLLLETKAPNIKLSQEVIDQVSVYLTAFEVPYFLISNGYQHRLFGVKADRKGYTLLTSWISYSQMLENSQIDQ